MIKTNSVVLGGDQWSNWSSTRLILGRGNRWICAFRFENALEKKTRRIQSIGGAQITRTGKWDGKRMISMKWFLGDIYVNAAKWSCTDSTISPRTSISTRLPSNGWWPSGKRLKIVLFAMTIFFYQGYHPNHRPPVSGRQPDYGHSQVIPQMHQNSQIYPGQRLNYPQVRPTNQQVRLPPQPSKYNQAYHENNWKTLDRQPLIVNRNDPRAHGRPQLHMLQPPVTQVCQKVISSWNMFQNTIISENNSTESTTTPFTPPASCSTN